MQKNAAIVALGLAVGIVYGVAAAAPPGNGRIVGNDSVRAETRTVRDFHGLDVSGAGELIVTQGEREALTIEAESNLLPYLESRVESGVLHLGVRKNASISGHKPIRYRVTLRNLDAIRASGAASIKTGAIRTGRLNADISGSGSLDMEQLKAEIVALDLSGASHAHLSGSADRQQIVISGAGDYDGAAFVTRTANLSLSGAANADIHASRTLSVEASGASSVRYRGNPQTTVKTSGASSVHPAN